MKTLAGRTGITNKERIGFRESGHLRPFVMSETGLMFR